MLNVLCACTWCKVMHLYETCNPNAEKEYYTTLTKITYFWPWKFYVNVKPSKITCFFCKWDKLILPRGFSINFLQGSNCFVQNAEGQMLRTCLPPPPCICAYQIMQKYESVDVEKKGHLKETWFSLEVKGTVCDVSRAKNLVILCETYQNFPLLIFKNSFYTKKLIHFMIKLAKYGNNAPE